MFFTKKYKNLIKENNKILKNIENKFPITNPPQKKEEEYRFIELIKLYFKVRNHWFFNEFETHGWEPQTYFTYKNYLTKETTYVDIGTWVGLTVMFASEIGVNKIYGIEANKLSYELTCENCKMNKLTEKATIDNLCILDRDNTLVHFGSTNSSETSSASSIKGNSWLIPSIKLMTYLKEKNIQDDKLFIKIDIEGAEELIVEDLKNLAEKKDIIIYLSIHPTFWDNKEVAGRNILDACYKFQEVKDSANNNLAKEKLEEMIFTEDSHPAWGTIHGNFFEVTLINI